MRLLLLEDDVDLGPLVARALRRDSHAVDLVGTLDDALDACRLTSYDVGIIDLGLPDGDGLDLIRRFTADPTHRPHRLLVLTARSAVRARIDGLDAGADDYLTKPFDLDELFARLRAIGRRRDRPDTVHRVDDLELDRATAEVRRGGRPIRLTAREFSMLDVLIDHPGRIVSAEELLERAWDAEADPFTSSPRVLMSRLRRKLGQPPLIETVRGAGYRLRVTP